MQVSRAIYDRAIALKGGKRLKKIGLEGCHSLYSGVGADSFPAFVRWVLTIIFKRFAPAVLIHDFDFEVLSKTNRNFHAANKRFLNNCITLAGCNRFWLFVAWVFFRLVNRYGLLYWR